MKNKQYKPYSRGWHWAYRVRFNLDWQRIKFIFNLPTHPVRLKTKELKRLFTSKNMKQELKQII